MHILILYLVLEFCRIKNFTQFLMYFLSIKNFKHLHEKVLERDMHARMQNSYARYNSGIRYASLLAVLVYVF